MLENIKFTFFYIVKLVLAYGGTIFLVIFVKTLLEFISMYEDPLWLSENKLILLVSLIIAVVSYLLLRLVQKVYPLEKEVDIKSRREESLTDKWWRL